MSSSGQGPSGAPAGAPGKEEREQIRYAFVAKNRENVLSEYTTAPDKQFNTFATSVLRRLEAHESSTSFTMGDFAFHSSKDDWGIWYVCMADREMGRQIPMEYLAKLKEAFKAQVTFQEAAVAQPRAFQESFTPTMKQLMERYNAPEANRIGNLQHKVREIGQDFIQSIDLLLEREERIDNLLDRSTELTQNASAFQRDAVQLHRAVRWRNRKTLMMLAAGALLFLFFVVWFSCGWRFQNC